ncbi:response regulator [Paraburkholderia terrae]|uniref:response regulator transcription factor n=1 Tax=Paraburkholderia terrae TaxID=311230 RepID=UPI0033653BA0
MDDDDAVRLAMDTLVRSFGKETLLFASAEEFLVSGLIAETACVLSDIMMDGMSGITMHEKIRELGYTTPMLFLTSFPTRDLTARAMTNGALAVLSKPVDPDMISHWLGIVLDSPR